MAMSEYLGIFAYFGVMLLTGVLIVVVSHWFQVRVKRDVYDWSEPYECGLESSGIELDRFSVHYYLVGILFVIFDVETVFFIPWAIIGSENRSGAGSTFWFTEMMIFIFILLVGYIYLLRRGVFDWGREDDTEALYE